MKDLLADIVGGLVLVTEQPSQIGDKVAIGEHHGEVIVTAVDYILILAAQTTASNRVIHTG